MSDINTMDATTSASASTITTTVAKSNNTPSPREYFVHTMIQRLKSNDPTLTSLRIDGVREMSGDVRLKTMQDWQEMGEAIATCTNLVRLDLYKLDNQIYLGVPLKFKEQEKIQKKFYAMLNENRSIRRLNLDEVDLFNGEIFTLHILPFLENNTSLTSLRATNYYSLGLEGTRLLSSALARKTGSSLKYLDLSSTGITDEACQELVVSALSTGHSGLRSLELNGNSIKNAGCAAIAIHLLKNPDSVLIRLYLDNNDIDDEGAEALADGLASANCCLKTLSIHCNSAITSTGYDAFSNALCNAPNVDDILLSNHGIQRIGAACHQLSTELKSSLGFNRVLNKHHMANRKVVMHHFVYNCNMDLLETVPGSLVPRVLATIADHSVCKNGRTDAQAMKEYENTKNDYKLRHLALHRIIRLCPSLCERRISPSEGIGRTSKRIRLG